MLAAVLSPIAARLDTDLEVASKVTGSEAALVDSVLTTHFDSPFARFAVVVVTGIPRVDTPTGGAILALIDSGIVARPGVSGTVSYLTTRDSMFVSPNAGATFLVVGIDPKAGRADALLTSFRQATAAIRALIRDCSTNQRRDAVACVGVAPGSAPAVELRWTGVAPLNADLRSLSVSDGQRAEIRVLPLTIVLLLLATGALVAALLPLATASLAIVITLGVAVLINGVWPLSVLLANIVTMIGLGVGIDYSLLTVSRFREALRSGLSSDEAAVTASRQAGMTILTSGAAVMIGFGAMLFVPTNECQSIGVGGIVVIGTTVLMAITFLPALLATLGTRVDRGQVMRLHAASNPLEGWWRRWGTWVVAHPWTALIAGSLPVLLLASQATRLNSDLPRGDWLPREIESARAITDLAAMKRDGVISTIRIVLVLPTGAAPLDESAWQAVRKISARIASDSRVARVQSLVSVVPTEHPSPMAISMLPPGVLPTLVSRDGSELLLDVFPSTGPDFSDLTKLARTIRELDAGAVGGLPGVRLLVGGLPAFNADYRTAINSRFATIVLSVVGLTLVALMIGFRSLLVPIKALVLNLLSVTASYGAVVLVFQDGHMGGLIGLDQPMNAVFPSVPLIVFCTVFGLSMDYEVFLVGRIAEARRTMGEREAVVEGLARTGGVITSAAAIMIAVFSAFTMGAFLFVKSLGFALVVAVLLDATIVRMAIGPALLVLAGKWNWWPGDRNVNFPGETRSNATHRSTRRS